MGVYPRLNWNVQLFSSFFEQTKERSEESNRWAEVTVCCYGNKPRCQSLLFLSEKNKKYNRLRLDFYHKHSDWIPTSSAFNTFKDFWEEKKKVFSLKRSLRSSEEKHGWSFQVAAKTKSIFLLLMLQENHSGVQLLVWILADITVFLPRRKI